jgi:hypothetical protein
MKKLVLVLSLLVVLIVVSAGSSAAAWSGRAGGGWHGAVQSRAWHGGGAWNGNGWHGGGGWGWHGGGWYGGGWHGAVIVGSPWWWGYPYAYPYAYGGYYGYGGYYPPTYGYPPVVADQGPSVYIQQQSAPAQPAASNDWYYCRSSGAYYPNVQTCSESWVRVPSTPR